MNVILKLACAAILVVPSVLSAKTYQEIFAEPANYEDESLNQLLESFDYKQGEVKLSGGNAILTIPENYYFLGENDARAVLEGLWGNPEAPGTLGMIFPTIYNPIDSGSWGVELTWDDIGYVSDEDAEKIDYSDMLETMQDDMRESSKWRIENGYDSIELVGWAIEPSYDQNARKLHWAQEIAFGGSETNTLNYRLRALGRRGVLQLNFIASINQLAEVEAALPVVAKMTAFEEGSRYIDFDPSLDKVAAVGIGGLIAGKVIAKTGFLVVLLVFLKKFAVFLILPVIWLFRKLKGSSNV